MAQPPIHQQKAETGTDAMKGATAEAGNLQKHLNKAKEMGGVLWKQLKSLNIPLELAAGEAIGFALKLTLGIGKSETLRRGLEKIARIQYYGPQFAKLLGGLDAAKRRLEEIDKFASRGVFDFEDAAEGNKTLETLGRGLLSSKQGMELVGDAAAVSGAKFSEMAGIVAEAYAGIADERPIDGAIDRMVAMGAVSAATGQKLKLMQSSGVATTVVLKAMQSALEQNRGGMDAAAQTINGLEKALAEAKTANDKAFADPFDEGKRAGLEAALKLTIALSPAFEAAGKALSFFFNAINAVAKGFADFVQAIPIVGALLNGLVDSFLALIAIMTIWTVKSTAEFLLSLAKMALGLVETATAWAVFRTAMLVTIGAINAAIGPIGWLFLGISALVGALSAFGSGSDDAAKMQEELKNKIKGTNDALREQIAAIQTQAEKSNAQVTAAKKLVDAKKKADDAKKKREDNKYSLWDLIIPFQGARKTWNNVTNPKMALGIEESNANTEMEKARQDAIAASAAQTNPELAARFGEDYQAVAKESAEKMSELMKKFSEAAAGGKDTSGIIAQMQAEAGLDLKGEADRRFNRKQIMGESQVAAMREVGARTGNRAMLDQADAKENDLFKNKRKKELQEQGLKGAELDKTLETDTLMNAITMQRNREGTPKQSSLAAIGGAGGFAGVVNDVPKQMLKRLEQLLQEVKTISGHTGKEDTDSKFEQP